MPSEYVARLLPQIRQILESSNLTTISAKAIRKTLISRGEDADIIKQNRDEIDAEIGEIYEQLCGTANSPSDVPASGASTSRPSPTPQIPQSSQPEPLHTKVIKKEQKPKLTKPEPVSEEIEEDDEAIARRLQQEYDALDSGGRSSRQTATRRKKKPISKKRVKTGSGSEDDDKPRKRGGGGGGGGAFNKEMILSDALAALVESPRLSRPQTVKKIWEHIKGNGLQDPTDGRMIICDDALRSVFHSDRVHMFTMNKLLGQHLRDPDDVIGENVK